VYVGATTLTGFPAASFRFALLFLTLGSFAGNG
jgi:hypothetical protein